MEGPISHTHPALEQEHSALPKQACNAPMAAASRMIVLHNNMISWVCLLEVAGHEGRA